MECPLEPPCEFIDPEGNSWPIALGLFVGLAMAYGIGANDAANSWGTSVGSGAIPVWIAVMIGGFMNFLGALLLGAGVSDTISHGVADLGRSDCWACTRDCDDYMDVASCDCECSRMAVFQVGMLSALLGGALFLLLATYTAMPVSTTHAIVGGVVGATIAGTKFGCLNWAVSGGLGGIILSWVISPVLAGIIGIIIFGTTRSIIFNSLYPEKTAVIAMPFLLSLTIYLVTFSVVFKKSDKLGGTTGIILIPLALTAISVAVGIYLMRRIKKKLAKMSLMEIRQMSDDEPVFSEEDLLVADDESAPATPSNREDSTMLGDDREKKTQSHESSTAVGIPVGMVVQTSTTVPNGETKSEGEDEKVDIISTFRAPAVKVVKGPQLPFQYLLVIVAAIESFAHGSNDTANATGAFAALFQTFEDGSSCAKYSTPWWIMGIAGLFVGIGVVISGRKVIETIGLKLTDIDCHMGFCIELATTSTVIGATFLRLPVSTTHCQVGAVVFVGAYRSGLKNVDWKTFGRIGLSWLVTLPFAGLVGFLGTLVLRPSVKS